MLPPGEIRSRWAVFLYTGTLFRPRLSPEQRSGVQSFPTFLHSAEKSKRRFPLPTTDLPFRRFFVKKRPLSLLFFALEFLSEPAISAAERLLSQLFLKF
jgi:hypothetical protein